MTRRCKSDLCTGFPRGNDEEIANNHEENGNDE